MSQVFIWRESRRVKRPSGIVCGVRGKTRINASMHERFVNTLCNYTDSIGEYVDSLYGDTQQAISCFDCLLCNAQRR